MFKNFGRLALMTALLFSMGSVQLQAEATTSQCLPPGLSTVALGCHYDVYYRSCPRSCWRFYGSYDCPHAAERAACRLDRRGYLTKIEHHD